MGLASEPVVAKLLELLDVNIKIGAVNIEMAKKPFDPRLSEEFRALSNEGGGILERCMLEMRKDSGFSNSTTSYRRIVFLG